MPILPLLLALGMAALGATLVYADAIGPALAGVLALGALMFSLTYPIIAYSITFLMTSWNTLLGTVGPLKITPFKLSFVAMAVAATYFVYRRGRLAGFPLWFALAYLSMGAIRLVSEMLAPTGSHVMALSEYLGTFAMLLIGSQILLHWTHLRTFSAVVAGALLIVTALVWVEMPWSALQGRVVRAVGPFSQSNQLGAVAFRLGLFALAMSLDRTTALWIRMLGGAAALGSTYCLLASGSRGASVALAFASLVFALVAQSGRRAFTRNAMIGVFSLVLLFAVAPKSYTDRMAETVVQDSEHADVEIKDSMRRELAAFALKMIPERPLLGHGQMGFAHQWGFEHEGTGVFVHTAYLGVAVAWGVPCALIYSLLMLFAPIVGARSAARLTGPPRLYLAALTATVTGEFVQAFGSPRFFDPPTWTMIGLAYVLAAHTSRGTFAPLTPQPTQTAPPPPKLIAQPTRHDLASDG